MSLPYLFLPCPGIQGLHSLVPTFLPSPLSPLPPASPSVSDHLQETSCRLYLSVTHAHAHAHVHASPALALSVPKILSLPHSGDNLSNLGTFSILFYIESFGIPFGSQLTPEDCPHLDPSPSSCPLPVPPWPLPGPVRISCITMGAFLTSTSRPEVFGKVGRAVPESARRHGGQNRPANRWRSFHNH